MSSLPPSSAENPLRLALFDLDGTLLPFDSDYAWGQFTCTLGWVEPLAFKRQNDDFYAQYQQGVLDVSAYCRFATAALREQGRVRSEAAHTQFMRDVVQPRITQEALALIQSHRAAGDVPIIITATNEFVTRPIAHALGVTELLALELERVPDTVPDTALDTAPDPAPDPTLDTGWITGNIHGVPSFREGKVTRLGQWLEGKGLTWDAVHTTFYSDSVNDLPLLERVNVPVATNPDPTLRRLASERGWRILDLFAQA